MNDFKPVRCVLLLESELHQRLKLKAKVTRCSMSGLVNAAVREVLHDDLDDLAAVKERTSEASIDMDTLISILQKENRT